MKYLDSNIFLYPVLYSDKKSAICKEILMKVAKNEIKASTSLLTWDEIVFAVKKLVGNDFAIAQGDKFLKFPNLIFIKVDESVISSAQAIIAQYGLNPRDAIHVASALIHGCEEFVSDDSDFDKVKEIKRIKIH